MKNAVFAALLLALASQPALADTERKRNAEKPDYDDYKHYMALQLSLIPEEKMEAGKPVPVIAKLVDKRTGRAVGSDQLKTVRTQKFHLLLVDPTLTDYRHIHPAPGDLPGVYRFTFTPKFGGGYRGWADVTPLATGNQQFVMGNLGRFIGSGIDKTTRYQSDAGGYHFTLSFDTPPQAKGESMGTVRITDAAGRPVTALEPVMGAYSHIVGFYDDLSTVVHTHPVGAEPTGASQRGGPDIMFHLAPEQVGYMRLFAQVRIGGEDIYAPFGFTVKEADESDFTLPSIF